MKSLFWNDPADCHYQVLSWLHFAELRKSLDWTRRVYSLGIALPFLRYESSSKVRDAQQDSHATNAIPVVCTCRPIVQAPHRRRACLQVREIFWKITILNDWSMRRRNVSNILCAKHDIKRISRDGLPDPNPVINYPLVEKNP